MTTSSQSFVNSATLHHQCVMESRYSHKSNKPTEAGLNADRGHRHPITVDSVFRNQDQFASDEGQKQAALEREIDRLVYQSRQPVRQFFGGRRETDARLRSTKRDSGGQAGGDCDCRRLDSSSGRGTKQMMRRTLNSYEVRCRLSESVSTNIQLLSELTAWDKHRPWTTI